MDCLPLDECGVAPGVRALVEEADAAVRGCATLLRRKTGDDQCARSEEQCESVGTEDFSDCVWTELTTTEGPANAPFFNCLGLDTHDDCVRPDDDEGFARCVWVATDGYANCDDLLPGCYTAETFCTAADCDDLLRLQPRRRPLPPQPCSSPR